MMTGLCYAKGVRTSLSTCDNIMAQLNRRECVALNGSWLIVSGHLDILQHRGVQTSLLELADRSDADIALLDNINLVDARMC